MSSTEMTKGVLPSNWEIAYSEYGDKYFIDHNTGTTQWEDPRDLPEGWEQVEDEAYGTFYVDHINKRTQYERPINGPSSMLLNNSVLSSVDEFDSSCTTLNNHYQDGEQNFISSDTNIIQGSEQQQQTPSALTSQMFTRDPSKLCGEIITTTIAKSGRGLGFTLIGNDGSSYDHEFLQIKNILANGPAYHDGVLRMGDVLVYVNNECVLGATQAHACRIFQSINVGEMVTLRVCRGYQLRIDPSNKIVVENAYNVRSSEEREILIRKGADGFGFTIFESMQGQRVKKILYPERCENLLEGDTLLQMRTSYPCGSPNFSNAQEHITDFRGMLHHQLVSILRDCPIGFWAWLLVRRNAPTAHRSRTPTAGFRYGEERSAPETVISPRSRTPAPNISRQSRKYMQSTSSPTFLPSNQTFASSSNGPNCPRNTLPRSHEAIRINDSQNGTYNYLSRLRPSSTSLGFATPNYIPINPVFGDNMETITVNLIRKPNGFGFRIVGGAEEGTPVTVGQIVPCEAAAEDGRLRAGDEIVEIDGSNVAGERHSTAVQLTQKAAALGHVKLIVRRHRALHHRQSSTFLDASSSSLSVHDVVLNRNEAEGFGFVIISSSNTVGSTIGRIMERSSAYRCGQLAVGDRVVAVNGIDIKSMLHSDIVDLIKDSGLSVRLSIVPASRLYNGVCNAYVQQTSENGATSSAISASCNQSRNYHSLQRNTANLTSFSNTKTNSELPMTVELDRGPKGFGFSIRGGQEFLAMPLFVLRIAEDGPAAVDGRLNVGDQILDINGECTKGMTHARAIQLIKETNRVKLILKRSKNF